MPRILRALEGLPPGTIVVVERRVTLGRAPDVDLQLLDPSVSRRHAKIEIDGDGIARLVDLASKSGTFVDGARVERCRLEHGQTVEIGRFHLRFEEIEDGTQERKPKPHVGMDAMRQTALFGPVPALHATIMPIHDEGTARLIVSEMAPSSMTVPPGLSGGANSPGRMHSQPDVASPRRPISPPKPSNTRARNSRRWTPTGVPADDVPEVSAEASTSTNRSAYLGEVSIEAGAPVMIRERDAPEPLASIGPISDEAPSTAWPREVVRNVFEYRELRLRGLRGEPLDEAASARLQLLEGKLQQQLAGAPVAAVRRFRRFDCPLPAWIGHREGRHVSTWAVELEDVSAGGAQVRCSGQPTTFAPGDACWLVVDLDDDPDQPVVVFRARVVWSLPADGRMGLVFSGAASCGIDAVELIRADVGV
jgi:FHA domain/PilZ domain